ncbi:MAG: lysophospholipid acyltransferase family protein [Candidatus Pacebacteria bacterium]|nr:lysophospholipid acyltransferase family protein [Candidatus Paceibacterota bacterium]
MTTPIKKVQRVPGLAMWTVATLVKLLHRTYRVTVVDRAGVGTPELAGPVIFSAWHNRLIFMPLFFPRRIRQKTAALASRSRDGQHAADLMRCFGMQVVRGSTSKGGHQALARLKRKLNEGVSVAITPDGPRGPRYHLQIGAIFLAEMAHCPIVPLSFNTSSRWELNGWDRTQIPKPFAKVQFLIGEPIWIHDRLDADARETIRRQIELAMMDVTRD